MTNYEKFLDEAKKKSRNVKPVSGPLIIPTKFSGGLSYQKACYFLKQYDKIQRRTFWVSYGGEKINREIYYRDYTFVEVYIKGFRSA